MSSAVQVNATSASNGHSSQEECAAASNSTSGTAAAATEPATPAIPASDSNTEQLKILGQLSSIEQINEQRRIFLKSTINEIQEEASNEAESLPEMRKPPPNSLALNVKYATLPSPSLVTSTLVRSPLSPPPKPPMLSRTRSTGSGDGRTPSSNGDVALLRHSVTETPVAAAAPVAETTKATATETATTTTTTATSAEQSSPTPPATISAKHYESLIEELRCPGCAGPMKAPVLLCKSGHSVCEQCTRILLMCPLCKVCPSAAEISFSRCTHSCTYGNQLPLRLADVSVSGKRYLALRILSLLLMLYDVLPAKYSEASQVMVVR